MSVRERSQDSSLETFATIDGGGGNPSAARMPRPRLHRSLLAASWAGLAILVMLGGSAPTARSTIGDETRSSLVDEGRPLPVAELVLWQDLMDHPSAWLGKSVRIDVQFQSRVSSWNPYMTRFGTRQFAAFQFWTDEQFPWVLSEFESPAVRLFARREGIAEWVLATAQPYARYEVQAVVREVFLDVPWVEMTAVRPLDERISEGTVIHAGRAIELMGAQAWKLASLELEPALAGPLPEKARAELERLRAICKEQAVSEPAIDARKKLR